MAHFCVQPLHQEQFPQIKFSLQDKSLMLNWVGRVVTTGKSGRQEDAHAPIVTTPVRLPSWASPSPVNVDTSIDGNYYNVIYIIIYI